MTHRIAGILLIALTLGACAGTTGDVSTLVDEPVAPVYDPWERLNRGVFSVNRNLDKVTLRPVAKGYRNASGSFLRKGVNNFFSNLRTPLTIVNQLLQGKGRLALSDSGRLLLNSTVGLAGLLDPATAIGLDKHEEDFGQTLAVWGVPDGPFVVVPLLGPRTLRDALAIPLNFFADPLLHYDNTSVRDKLWGLQAVQVRARLLAAERLLEDSYDPYITTREAWLQNRRYEIYDGDPPEGDDGFFDEFIGE